MAVSMPPEPDVADFLDHIERHRAFALRPFSPAVYHPYTPSHVLQRYFTRGRIKQLLRYFYRPEGDWETIQNEYLAVFSTLTVIKRGTYITHFIQSHKHTDGDLPFMHRAGWPPDCLEFFDDFYQAQWQFCAERLKRQKLNDLRFGDEIIIPIIRCDLLKDGVDSQTYKIEVDASYNFLADRDERGAPVTNTFVLKTCQAKDAKSHHYEVEAYKALTHQIDISRHIARFYGSWVQFGMYNMILEYVEGGTLADFFQTVEPPTSEEDIGKFWRNLLDIIKVVERIHELPSSNSKQEYMQGIHHDIKPANILVSRPYGQSRFDVTFKLADLGLTTFEVKAKKGEAVEVRDGQGTQMYTAPEYCRDDSFLEQSILRAKPSKDIWSLGCVYSEAAVWSVFGKERLAAYWEHRRAATELIPELRASAYSGCFHDGERVLQAVIDMHMHVRNDRRRNDHIVGDVIVLIEDMLEEVAARPGAVEVYRRSRKALNRSVNAWGKEPARGTDDDQFPPIFGDSADPPSIRHQPPELPPEGPYAAVGLGLRTSQTIQSSSGFMPDGQPGSSAASPASHVFPKPETVVQHLSNPSRIVSFGSSNRDSHTSSFSEGNKYTSYGGSPTAYSHSRHISHQPRDENDITPSPGPTSSSNCCDSGECASPSNTEGVKGKAPVKTTVDPINPVLPNGTHGLMTKAKPDFPQVSVTNVLSWITNMKDAKGFFNDRRSAVTPLKGHEYLGRLDGRDQVFLVDDSATMSEHWNNVKDVIQALGYLVKESDRDTMDLYFTNSSEEAHCEDTSTLMSTLDRVTPGSNKCDMKRALGMILEKHHPENMKEQEKNTKKQEKKWKPFSSKKKKRKKKEKRGVNIYVLTDGVWQERPPPLCGVEKPIKIMVEKLTAHGWLESHVGIEFISFGSHPTGIKRLKRLDSGLKEFGVTMDIVDTEHHTGNVWKMLLGSFDEHWDNDSEAGSVSEDPEKG